MKNQERRKETVCECGCGHEHHHEEECSCGHEHHHEEECSCEHEHHHHHDHHHEEECGSGHEHHHHEIEEQRIPSMPEGVEKRVYILANLGCANCAAKMERQIRELPGVEMATITFATKQLIVAADNQEKLLPEFRRICA